MKSIKEKIDHIRDELPPHVTLVAVSKTKPDEDIMKAYEAGHKIFGENKVQELTGKYEHLPKDIEWHMIGHLQRNKVKYIAPFISLIHAVDSFRLLSEINKQALKNNRIIPCLLQVHIAEEETKHGFFANEISTLVKDPALASLKNIEIRGLMGMATFTNNQEQIRKEFREVKRLFEDLKNDPDCQKENTNWSVLSMGMTNDYQIAIEEGSTMIRLGSSIFGLRACQVNQ